MFTLKRFKRKHTAYFNSEKSIDLRVNFDYDLKWYQAVWGAVHQNDTKEDVALG